MQNKEQMRKLLGFVSCIYLDCANFFPNLIKAQQSTTCTHLYIKGTKQKRKGSNIVSLIILDSILQGTQKTKYPG